MNHFDDSMPPRWPIKLLRYFIRSEYAEELEGDLEERFQDDLERYNQQKAKRLLVWQVLKLIRPALVKKISGSVKLNNYGMFKNNIKTVFRIFKREKLYTGINIVGLTAGLSVALLILAYVHFEVSYESYNPNAGRVARVTIDYLDGGTLIDRDAESYHLLGPMMKEEFPEVEDFARAFRMGESVLKVDDQSFRAQRVFAVDPAFLELFHYPLIHGNEHTVMTSQLEAVLTKSAAMTYFGTTDVVGKTMWASVVGNRLKIVGVAPDSPADSHMKFDLLFSYNTMQATLNKRESQWDSNDTFTYLLLKDASMQANFSKSVQRLSDRLVEENKISNERIVAQRMQDIHLYSHKSYELEANGDATVVYFLFFVALLVITIAIVNYINLATAKSMDRAKEVGIRKVIGSGTQQLRFRFFTESLLINVFSALLSLFVIFLVLPYFKQMAGLPAGFNVFNNPLFWRMLIGLTLASTLIGGAFPAFILSALKPVTVLKGKFTHSGRGIFLRKALVIFQFSIAVILLIQTLTATRQLDFMQSKDLGLDAEQVVVVSAPATAEEMKGFKLFRNELTNYSSFQSAALSTAVPSLPTSAMGSSTGINLVNATEEHNFNFYIYQIDHQFLPTMGFEILAGENFREQGNEHSLIVNEETIRLWGIQSPGEAINQKVKFWGDEKRIVAVLKNFHQTGVKSGHIPMILNYANGYGDFVSVRTNPGDAKAQVDQLEALYKSHFDSPFEFFFMDQKFDTHFKSDQQFQSVFSVLSVFALIITCLGLLGLSSYTVAKRRKEIGIRKVLGASVREVIQLISRDFVWLIAIATLISLPVTYYMVNSWLDGYAYRIDMSPWLLMVPAALVFAIAFMTIFSQTLKVSQMNPVHSLRDE